MGLKRVAADHTVTVFSKALTPILSVESGEEVLFETRDARGGRPHLGEEYTPPPLPPFEKLNPVTGPVEVVGAEPGDALVAEILEIELASCGYAAAKPTTGVLKDWVRESVARCVRVAE